MTSVERHEPRNSRIIRPVSAGGDHRLAEDAAQRRAHEHRLIEQRLDVELGRQRRLDARQRVAARAARCRASTRAASSGPSAAPSAGRRRAPSTSAAAKPSCTCATSRRYTVARPILPHRDVVERLEDVGRRVGADDVLGRPHLRRAGRQDDVLRVERVRDVDRRQTLGVERVRVEVDHDLPRLAAAGQRHLRALHGGELRADEVQAVVVELLLAERRRLERQLQDRDVGGRVADDERRRGAGRQDAQQRSG